MMTTTINTTKINDVVTFTDAGYKYIGIVWNKTSKKTTVAICVMDNIFYHNYNGPEEFIKLANDAEVAIIENSEEFENATADCTEFR